MREIEFRVWSERYKTYNYEHHHNTLGNFYINQNGAIFSDYYKYVTPELRWNKLIVEQYTWIKDRNDRKIYEGDIVSEHNGDLKGVVKQAEDGQWVIYWDNIPDGRSVLFEHSNFCEVIGDIHNNPELLENKNEE